MSTEVSVHTESARPPEIQATMHESVPPALADIARALRAKSFTSHPLLTNGHMQTLAGYLWPRHRNLRQHRLDQPRLFEVEPGVQLLAQCRWHAEPRRHPTMMLVHGLEGASTSIYMVGTADKAYRAGFNTVRLNLRNCGHTEHLTPTLYHSGMTADLLKVLRELIAHDELPAVFLVGFSMSGNMALKLAGAEAGRLPAELRALCAVSPAIEPKVCALAMERRSNWIYQQSFMRSVYRRMRQKKKLFPELYDISDLKRIRTIRQFDERYTAIMAGFRNADHYYDETRSLPVIPRIRIPSLVIHAEDDPFVPFEPLRDPAFAQNPYILLMPTRHGGHVGFVGARANGEDRFWAENRVVEYCRLVHERMSS